MKNVIFAIVGMVIGLSSAWADGLSDIKSKGVLTCGVLGDLVPLGYEDPKTRSLVGLDVDICGAIAQDLGVKLELKAVSERLFTRLPNLRLAVPFEELDFKEHMFLFGLTSLPVTW